MPEEDRRRWAYFRGDSIALLIAHVLIVGGTDIPPRNCLSAADLVLLFLFTFLFPPLRFWEVEWTTTLRMMRYLQTAYRVAYSTAAGYESFHPVCPDFRSVKEE